MFWSAKKLLQKKRTEEKERRRGVRERRRRKGRRERRGRGEWEEEGSGGEGKGRRKKEREGRRRDNIDYSVTTYWLMIFNLLQNLGTKRCKRRFTEIFVKKEKKTQTKISIILPLTRT